MSVEYADGPCDVYRERIRRARKDHRCDACRNSIRRGDLYSMTFLVFDGETETVKRCARCELIFRHLEDVSSGDPEDGVDRELNCGHTYQEIHRCDPPPEIAALAFATPEEAQALIMSMLEKKSHLQDNR